LHPAEVAELRIERAVAHVSAQIFCPKYWLMTKLRLENWTVIDTDKYITTDYNIYK
jgi:hypothetical protein